jgi:hypothetical protein
MLLRSDIRTFLAWVRNRPLDEIEDPHEFTKRLCQLGSHDYEFVEMTPDGALLRCFYCEHEKVTVIKTNKEDR